MGRSRSSGSIDSDVARRAVESGDDGEARRELAAGTDMMAKKGSDRPAESTGIAPKSGGGSVGRVTIRRVRAITPPRNDVDADVITDPPPEPDDDDCETSRFKADELHALMSSSKKRITLSGSQEDSSIDITFEDVVPRETQPEPSFVPAPVSRVEILAKTAPTLVIPERITERPAVVTRADLSPVDPSPADLSPVDLSSVDPSPVFRAPIATPSLRSVVLSEPPPRSASKARAPFDWRESNLARKPAAFNFANGLVELVAIVVGFAATTLCLMALIGMFVDGLAIHIGVAAAIALVVPAIVTRWRRPKDDPLIAIGLTTETYALLLLGFAVAFVIASHDRTASLLADEGDRAARIGVRAIARAEWFLARVERVERVESR